MPNELETPEATESFVDDVLNEDTQSGAEGHVKTPDGKDPTSHPSPAPQSDELRTALAELTKNVSTLAQPKPEAPRQPTRDEINEYWKVWNPTKTDPEFFSKFLRLPQDMDPQERQAAVDQFSQLFGLMQTELGKQYLHGAQLLMQQELQKIRAEITPLQETVSSQNAERLRGEFHDNFPALADSRYAQILRIASMELTGKTFDSKESYFKALAERAGGIIKQVDASFDLKNAPSADGKPTKPAVTTPRLPRSSVGGTGGTGGGRVPAKLPDDDSGTLAWMKD